MHWSVMEWALKRGLTAYNMCGPGKFKQKFGGELVPIRRWQKYYSPMARWGRAAYATFHDMRIKMRGRLARRHPGERSGRLMRVLYISVAYPLPANNGAKMRLWSLLRAIKSAGHEVTLACFAEPDEVAGTERELSAVCAESDIVPLSYTRLSAGGDYWKRLRAIFSSSPFTIDRFRSDEMRARLEQRVRDRSLRCDCL